MSPWRLPALRPRRASGLLAFVAPLALAGGAHQHGVATLDVAVDATSIVVQFDSPLDNLLGFERAPRADAERQQVRAAVARLESAAQMLSVDPAANCRPLAVELKAPVLGIGTTAPAGKGSEHADLEAIYRFECTDAARAGYLEVGLFEFKGLQRLQVQLVTPAGQFKRELKRPARRLVLGR